MNFPWSTIEQTTGKDDLSAFDTLVSAAEARRLSVLAILDHGPPLHTALADLIQYSGAPAGVHVLRLDGISDSIYIVWAEEPVPAFTLLISFPGAQLKNMTGQSLAATAVSNQLSISLSPARGPIFVQIPTNTTAQILSSDAVVTVAVISLQRCRHRLSLGTNFRLC